MVLCLFEQNWPETHGIFRARESTQTTPATSTQSRTDFGNADAFGPPQNAERQCHTLPAEQILGTSSLNKSHSFGIWSLENSRWYKYIHIYILNYIYTDNTVSQAENSRRGANKMVLNDCMAVLGSLSLDLLLRCYSYSSSGTGSGDTQLGLTWIDIGLWVNQCHKPPIWEWFRHVYTTYQNGDDWGMVIMTLFYPH